MPGCCFTTRENVSVELRLDKRQRPPELKVEQQQDPGAPKAAIVAFLDPGQARLLYDTLHLILLPEERG